MTTKKDEEGFVWQQIQRPPALDDALLSKFGKKLKYDYTSEAEIREHIMSAVKLNANKRASDLSKLREIGVDFDASKLRPKKLTDEEKLKLTEEWIQKQVKNAKKQNRLMTEQQLKDWRQGIKFTRGMRARYVGPSRDERTTNGIIVPREFGQLGTIINIEKGERTELGRIIVFHPDEAVEPKTAGKEKQFADLFVREGTPGWLHIERVPLKA